MKHTRLIATRHAVAAAALGMLAALVLALLPTTARGLRGGEEVKRGFPGIVDGMGCTGSMIAPNVILTAAHCFFPPGAAPTPRGTGTFSISYHDPRRGKRGVFSGSATFIVPPSFKGDASDATTAGQSNADHGLILISRPLSPTDVFKDTDYHDYLRLYADAKGFLNTELQAYGAGMYTYSGKDDGKLRTKWLEVEDVDYNHLVVDTRDKVSVCKGDSGGPLVFTATAGGHSIPTIAGVLATGDGDEDNEGENCANNDPPGDDVFASRVSWKVIRFIQAQTGITCHVQTGASRQYVRCFDLPFIEDVEFEGIPRDLAVAMAVGAIM